LRHETPKRNLPVLPWDGNGSKLEDPRRRLIGLLPELRGYARFLARDRAEADDLVQDAVVRALAALPRLSDDAALRPWLFTILRNTFYEQARRRRTERTVLSRQVTGSEAATPGQHGSLDLADLQRHLFRLPPRLREALVLVGAQGLSYEEAAAICGVPEGTMKARVSRARSRLIELMAAVPAADLSS
jgi:RNA polymerase sigma-70 factor (ECF subfamily)